MPSLPLQVSAVHAELSAMQEELAAATQQLTSQQQTAEARSAELSTKLGLAR